MTSSGKSCDEPSSSGSFPENDIIKGGLLNFSNKGPNKVSFCTFKQFLLPFYITIYAFSRKAFCSYNIDSFSTAYVLAA